MAQFSKKITGGSGKREEFAGAHVLAPVRKDEAPAKYSYLLAGSSR